MLETQVQSLGQEDSLGKKMASHSGILAREIAWTVEPGGLQYTGCKELDMTEQRSADAHFCTEYFGLTKMFTN